MASLLAKIFGTKNEREIKRLNTIVGIINDLEPSIQVLSDEELAAKTPEFKERLAEGELLDDILPEAFAVAREASVRALGMRPFDMQVLGGLAQHEGRITEMKTGEGKTLVATMPIYLNALFGKGAHVVTVNDYLAKRDSEWMGRVYRFLGLSVGVIVHGMSDKERREAYGSDITYGTNNELGFDYLRDNMKLDPESFVQRGFYYAIVDEVDSILVDEARTPLIISGPSEDATDRYYTIERVVKRLRQDEHFNLDEKAHSAMLTEEGVERVQGELGIDNLYDPSEIDTVHHVQQALKAHSLFQKDKDYIVKDGQVIIVDEFTGRLMSGRRYSDGLHQALEAKENVKIESENQTLASITFQNLFRMYDKLAGMTGTADTEAAEFKKIYELDVLIVPTNKPMIRDDNPDVIYRSSEEKFKAIVDRIAECNESGQPVLVGTISIEKNEMLAKMLKKKGVPYEVLNAKQHDREAEIIAQAGRKGHITLATNMAGRGTDIVLGGNAQVLTEQALARQSEDEGEIPGKDSDEYRKTMEEKNMQCLAERQEVLDAGGLCVIGTERHESRRIDNQLRGRSGRQGDPGESVFYLALDDDLMRIFGSDKMDSMLGKLGVKADEPIYHPWISRAIATAQEKVEGHNFDIRKHLLEYDDVMNQQRNVIYDLRRGVLFGDNTKENFLDIADGVAGDVIAAHIEEKNYPENWPWDDINELIATKFLLPPFQYPEEEMLRLTPDALTEDLAKVLCAAYEEKESIVGEKIMRDAERFFFLTTIDQYWKDHLLRMDHLRDGIGLRGYGQVNPLLAYKKEGYEMFSEMIDKIREQALEKMLRFQVQATDESTFKSKRAAKPMNFGRGALRSAQNPEAMPEKPKGVTVRRQVPKVGPNDPCPCGSGKKYKKCCRDKDKAELA